MSKSLRKQLQSFICNTTVSSTNGISNILRSVVYTIDIHIESIDGKFDPGLNSIDWLFIYDFIFTNFHGLIAPIFQQLQRPASNGVAADNTSKDDEAGEKGSADKQFLQIVDRFLKTLHFRYSYFVYLTIEEIEEAGLEEYNNLMFSQFDFYKENAVEFNDGCGSPRPRKTRTNNFARNWEFLSEFLLSNIDNLIIHQKILKINREQQELLNNELNHTINKSRSKSVSGLNQCTEQTTATAKQHRLKNSKSGAEIIPRRESLKFDSTIDTTHKRKLSTYSNFNTSPTFYEKRNTFHFVATHSSRNSTSLSSKKHTPKNSLNSRNSTMNFSPNSFISNCMENFSNKEIDIDDLLTLNSISTFNSFEELNKKSSSGSTKVSERELKDVTSCLNLNFQKSKTLLKKGSRYLMRKFKT